MGTTSTQLTDLVSKQPNPLAAAFKIWQNVRYLVAQKPAAKDYNNTKPGYYNGKYVIPGPKCNTKLSSALKFKTLNINDFQILISQYYIRFIDNLTSDNAEDSVKEALYTVMSNSEADDYESKLKKYYDNQLKSVSS